MSVLAAHSEGTTMVEFRFTPFTGHVNTSVLPAIAVVLASSVTYTSQPLLMVTGIATPEVVVFSHASS